MAQTKPKAGQFYGVSNNGTDGEFLQTDGAGGMAWAATITDPTITSIDYPGSATAADPAGGESVIINGTLFASGITCTVGGTSAVTAFNSATQITITTPAKAAGPYTVAVTNTDGGTASQASFIQYSGVPVWSTAAGTLGNIIEGAAASFQVTATEGSDTIEYAVTTGTLPTGLSLATATGAITGTAGSVSADTTTTFSITATDDENQTSSERSFSITVQNDAPSNHFNTVLYTGNNTAKTVSVGFAPDLVWIKNRNNSTNSTHDHNLFDSLRTTGYRLKSNSTAAQNDYSSHMSGFTSDGFNLTTTGALNDGSGSGTYVAWNFKAGGAAVANTDGTLNTQVSVNNTLGFSIVSGSVPTSGYTNTLGHGLSSAPELIIYKTTNITGAWYVFANYGGSLLGNNNVLRLNDLSAASSDSLFDITSTTFKTGASSSANEFIAYCFKSKPGFSKVGSYTGNGSTNGTIVQTGFEPAFVMIKSTSSSGTAWNMWDNKRTPYDMLRANASDAEYAGPGRIQFFANGFQLLDADASRNSSGGNYIYLAFAADGSTATPSLANSFATEIYTGNGNNQTITNVGFNSDFTWTKSRTETTGNWLFDTMRGSGNYISSNTTGANISVWSNYGVHFDTTNGFTVKDDSSGGYYMNKPSATYVTWNWKVGGTPSINTDGTTTSIVSANQAAGFSIVKFSGNLSSAGNIQVGHGLNVAPELIIQKNINGTGTWWARPFFLNSNPYQYLGLSESATLVTSSSSDGTMSIPTSTTFDNNWNTSLGSSSGTPIIAYCFTSISGFSKVGSYSGNQSLSVANQINFGFTPGFVMIKNTTNSGSQWMIFDSARTNGYALYANSNSAESNYSTDLLLSSQGLEFKSTNINVNQSGSTYIYLAIKEN